jgi:hypothetical protein
VAAQEQTPSPLAAPTFELKRFAWATPDRLELSGTFGGLRNAPADAPPVLVLRAGERVHRLPAVPESLSGPPDDGHGWHAEFAWQDAPVAFEVAELQLGAELTVELPAPNAKRRLTRARALEVRTAEGRRETMENVGGRGTPAETVGSQVELLAAQEEVREVQVAMQRVEAELTRTRDDLRAERERRAVDSERFRDGLAKLRESAEAALAAEQDATIRVGTDLREAHEAIEAKDAALETLRGQLEAAGAERTQAESKARAEAETLREQLAKFESDAKDAERLRAELATTHGSIDEARNDAERLLGRLTAIRAQ